jgi:hypothetical protein
MARAMKAVRPPPTKGTTLVVTADPLRTARGHRSMPRGKVHATARRPSRAAVKNAERKNAARESGRDPMGRSSKRKTPSLQLGDAGATPAVSTVPESARKAGE